MSNEASITEILQPKYGILDHVNRALRANDIGHEHLSNLLWLIANLIVESFVICHRVITKTNALENIARLTGPMMQTHLHPKITQIFPWLAQNILLYTEYDESQK